MEWFRTPSVSRARSVLRRQDRPRVRALARAGAPFDRFCLALASTFFTGFLPLGGLWGAFAGTGVAAMMPSPLASSCLLAATIAIGIALIARVHRAAGVDDPSEVTIDEVAGAWLACLVSGLHGTALWLPLAAFCLFDATKPLPANLLDRHPGALGVMGDDLVAGLYGGLLARAVSAALPSAFATVLHATKF